MRLVENWGNIKTANSAEYRLLKNTAFIDNLVLTLGSKKITNKTVLKMIQYLFRQKITDLTRIH